jgi:hypothetical protein
VGYFRTLEKFKGLIGYYKHSRQGLSLPTTRGLHHPVRYAPVDRRRPRVSGSLPEAVCITSGKEDVLIAFTDMGDMIELFISIQLTDSRHPGVILFNPEQPVTFSRFSDAETVIIVCGECLKPGLEEWMVDNGINCAIFITKE